jgi:hypothetical protein
MRRLVILLTLLLALAPAAPTYARSATVQKVLADCSDDGRIEGHFTQSQLQAALHNIPSDIDEYTNCRDVIRRAALAAAGGGKGGGGAAGGSSGGEFGGFTAPQAGADPLATATPAERGAVSKATTEGGQPLQLSDAAGHPIAGLIRPSQVARRTGPGTTDVPTPLLIVAVMLALAALAAAAPTFRHRVLPRRSA